MQAGDCQGSVSPPEKKPEALLLLLIPRKEDLQAWSMEFKLTSPLTDE